MSKWPCSRFLLLLASLLVISGTSTSLAHDRREIIKANHGVVATDDGRCSRIGRDVLREGGHAVDAAVAAAFCLGVVSPASSGIGGGAFMLIRSADGKAQAFDMRETAPKKASKVFEPLDCSIKQAYKCMTFIRILFIDIASSLYLSCPEYICTKCCSKS